MSTKESKNPLRDQVCSLSKTLQAALVSNHKQRKQLEQTATILNVISEVVQQIEELQSAVVVIQSGLETGHPTHGRLDGQTKAKLNGLHRC